MSNGKESLKKSLGITEYPWSSDDEDSSTPQAGQDAHLLRRTSDESRPSVADMPGTSGEPPVQPLLSSAPAPPLRRCYTQQNKTDQDLFWSWLNKSHKPSTISVTRSRLGNVPLSCVSRPINGHSPVQDLRDRNTDRPSPSADIQHILAFKKLTRSLNTMRQRCRPNTSLYTAGPSRGNSGTTRNPIVTPPPSMHMPSNSLQRYHRAHPGLRKAYTIPPNIQFPTPPFGRSVNQQSSNTAPAPALPPDVEAPPRTAPLPDVDITHSDEEIHMAIESISLPASRNNSNVSQENVEDPTQNIPSGGMSLEEEIVEIDAADETVANPNADMHMENLPANANDMINTHTADNTSAGDEASQTHGVKRKRDAPEDTNPPYSVKDFNQSLLRLLECPVCLEWMEPPISQCRRGHLVCSRCRARLASCPVCRTMFSSVRNRAMEGVAEMLRYPCRHGCGREVRLRRRAAHESSCAARHYHCPAPACADRHPMPHDHLAQHFQSKHLSLLKIGRKHKFTMKVNAEQHDNWLIMTLGEYFNLRVDVDIHTWGVSVYVAYIGPKCKASNFTYEVSVDGQHNSRKLMYTRVTHSDLENCSLNVSRQDCFHLTLDQALNFLRFKNRHCEPDKFLDFNVEITKSEVVDSAKEDSDS